MENRWITLEGAVQWSCERAAAGVAVKDLLGVTGVSANITIQADVSGAVEKTGIENVFKRNWSVYDAGIDIKISGHKATLTATVDSWFQKEEAGRIASKAPGVWQVDNELIVDYDYSLMNV